jgi:magnesium transporter
MTDKPQSSLPPEFDQWIASKNYKALRPILKLAEPADIGEHLAILAIAELIIIFRLIPRSRRAQVFAYVPFERQEELLEDLPEAVVSTLLNDMEPDDRTRLLEDLPFEIRSKILLKLSPEERSMAWKLLSYDQDSVGRLMNPELIAVSGELKVLDALEFIRWSVRAPEELHSFIFVIDPDGRYKGEVSLASLILADPPTKTLVEVMDSGTVTLTVSDDKGMAVDFFRKYDKAFSPVVDAEGILVGVLSADDVFDIAEDEATDDIQQFGGTAVLEDSYFETPGFVLLRKRAGWLCALFISELFTGTALRHYDETIAEMRYLVYFVPLVISSGGNSGSQASSLVIRGLAVREMKISDWRRVFGREVRMGLGLGLILGSIGFLRAWTWEHNLLISMIVGSSLVGVVLFGSVVGAVMPFLIKRLKFDPAVSSSPFIASLVDVAGIVLYFNVALWMVRSIGPMMGLHVPGGG